MGLDARVYCNCFETGRLQAPPPTGLTLHVGDDGALQPQDDLQDDLWDAFDHWRAGEACEHPGGVLLHHRLGNIELVGLLRNALQAEATTYPTLWKRVLYSGSHASDHIAVDLLASLQREAVAL